MSGRSRSKPDVTVRCVPAADLTAYAHGELPDVRRAEVSRHLLRCARCRAEADASRALFDRLRSFGAEGEDWRAEIAAAGAHVSAGRRATRRIVVAGALAASVLLAVTLSLRFGPEPSAGGDIAQLEAYFPGIGVTLLPEDESALLQAQQMDGRWAAGGGRRDEAATSLAVAALAGRYGRDLADDTVGQAVRTGVEWLLARQGYPVEAGVVGEVSPLEIGDARIGQDGAEAGAAHALATTALLEVYAATRDRTLRQPIDRALRALEHASRADLSGDATLRWAHRALSRARELGWDGLDSSVRRVEDWMGGETRVADHGASDDPSALMALAIRMISQPSRG